MRLSRTAALVALLCSVALSIALVPVVATSAAAGTGGGKVLIVMLENESRIHALAGMPRLAATANTYGYATHDSAIRHPSLPNYLAIAGGSTFGVSDDAPPSSHHVLGSSIFDQAIASRHTAKVYAESMTTNCQQVAAGRYAVKHNPWTYFSGKASRANCLRADVPAGTVTAGALHHDVSTGQLPTVGMIVPNICDDGHDCSLRVADAWLAGWLRTIQAGPDWRGGRLTVIVTFDEDDYSERNTVLTVVLNPAVRHRAVSTPLDHYSITAFADSLAGAQPLRNAARAPSLAAAFHLS